MEQSAYEAAIIPELWPKVFASLVELTDTAGGAFAILNERGSHIVCAPALDGARERILAEGYLSRSGRAQGVIGKGLVGVPRFLNEHDYYDSPADADRDPIVADVFQKEGFGWAAGWLLNLPHDDLLIMNVEQYRDRGPIVGEALARLDCLYAVFARAGTFAARAGFERVRTAIETLTAVGLPAAAVTPSGKVVLANAGFDDATEVWTTRGSDRLGLHDPVADKLLANCLGTLAESDSPRSIPIRAATGGAVVAVLQVVPVHRAAHDIFGSTDAIVILSAPKSGKPDARLIHSLFDLTPTEIDVARAISAGQSVTQIARARGTSVETVRKQLKNAMAKTGSNRQVELAILIRQLGISPG